MSLRITDQAITSTVTGHTARRGDGGQWVVSWLPAPALPLDRNAAITAMTLAEFVAAGAGNPAHRHWPHVRNWAAELGLSGEVAAQLAAEACR